MRRVVIAVVILVASMLAGRAAALVLPSKATTFKGFLVTAYEPCTAPDRTLGAGGLAACAARRSFPGCGLTAHGNGQFLVKVAAGDVVVLTKLTGLESSCEGVTLETKIDLALSSDDCSTDECTTTTVAASGGSCVVSGGKCRSKQLIGPALMGVPAPALAAPGRTYGLEVRRVRVVVFDAFTVLTSGLKVPKPAPACTGMTVGGSCWYLGDAGASCTSTCAAQGLAYDPATETYAGSSGSDDQCVAVLSALTPYSISLWTGVTDCGVGLGCHLADYGAVRCPAPPTTADAAGEALQLVSRACACGAPVTTTTLLP